MKHLLVIEYVSVQNCFVSQYKRANGMDQIQK